jgi:hypothetical protein
LRAQIFEFAAQIFALPLGKNLFLNRGMDFERSFELVKDRVLVFFGFDFLEQLLNFLVVTLQEGYRVFGFRHFYLHIGATAGQVLGYLVEGARGNGCAVIMPRMAEVIRWHSRRPSGTLNVLLSFRAFAESRLISAPQHLDIYVQA